MENIDLAANPDAGTFLEDETNRMMTFFQQGFATLPWGQPPSEIVRETDALVTDMPAEKYYVRGTYNSPESKVLIKFIMHNISDDKFQYTDSLLLGGDSHEEVVPGEPMLIDCSRVSDPPQPCRLGPYGYDQGEAVALLRLIRGTVRIPYYPRSQKMDKVQFQQTSHDKRPPALELTSEDILCIDSDLCFDWPWADSDGVFVLMIVGRGLPRLDLRRVQPPMPVVPFHSSQVIRFLEHEA